MRGCSRLECSDLRQHPWRNTVKSLNCMKLPDDGRRARSGGSLVRTRRSDCRSRPHARGSAQRRPVGGALGRPVGPRPRGAADPYGDRSRRRRRRHLGCRPADRHAGQQRGAGCGACRWLAGVGSRHHDRPAVRLLPAGCALRCRRTYRRSLRRRGGRWRGGHERDPDRRDDFGSRVRLRLTSVRPGSLWGGAFQSRDRRRDDCREVGTLAGDA